MLTNNAGEMRMINLHDTTNNLPDITLEIEINLMGPVRMVQQFLSHLKTKRTAAILNVTSGLALVPFPLSPVYRATKSGLRSYTQSLRVQLKKTNIKVFELLAPGSDTPLNDKFTGVEGFNSKMLMEPGKIVEAAIRGLEKINLRYIPAYPAL